MTPERTLSSRTGFQGKHLKVDVLDVEIEPGVNSVREIVRHPGAAAVVGEFPDGRFLLVRQYRKAVEESVLEFVAGGLEPGESPEQCAVREMREEAGYEVQHIDALGVTFPAPGYTAERIHLFHARLKPERGQGCCEADERIECVVLTGDEVERLIGRGEIRDGKTLCAWLLLKARGKIVP